MTVVVIGGGPAGMMAAYASSKAGAPTILFEKNEKLGKKLYISGKGRCNLTNNCTPNEFLKNVVSNPKFITTALYSFPPTMTMQFFEDENVRLKVERGNRVFPESDKSSDIINAFTKALKRNNVEVKIGESVDYFEFEDDKITSVVSNKKRVAVSAVVLAAGGLSYPATGASEAGYKLASLAGHRIIAPRPALCQIIVSNLFDYSKAQIPISKTQFPTGLSLKNIAIKVIDTELHKTIATDFGEALFTSNGLSGPVVLSTSSKINRCDLKNLRLIIDLKPALSEDTLDARLIREFDLAKNKSYKSVLDELLPKSLIEVVAQLTHIPLMKPINSITRNERRAIVYVLKNLSFDISALGSISDSIVTAGGIAVDDINPRTMGSKLIKNLFFAGEVIDIDALTGGFNIQIALSTGYLAGASAAKASSN
ncbi:MAG: NAD(P)/FAD-dependent oxidoreductase [Christensenellaceae bacterium]|jgi:predicted Rossmann fold flavoprotein|nr:NAD(P)/FAD-dependent oxidoreductase [Christensenellaceae bacterium]